MQLKHLNILFATFGVPVAGIATWLARFRFFQDSPVLYPATVVASTVLLLPVSLQVAWWICRLFGYFPPLAFSPACPHCGQRPRLWGWKDRSWRDKMSLCCYECSGILEVYESKRKALAPPPSGLPRYWLRWPQFLGLWRQF